MELFSGIEIPLHFTAVFGSSRLFTIRHILWLV